MSRYDRFGEPLDDDLDQEDPMTAARPARPIRHARSWTAGNTDGDQPDPLDVAHAEVDDARAQVQAARRAVTARTAGVSSLATAEWRLSKALDRLAELNGSPPPGFPSAAGPDDAA